MAHRLYRGAFDRFVTIALGETDLLDAPAAVQDEGDEYRALDVPVAGALRYSRLQEIAARRRTMWAFCLA